jgi:uncharacterized protein
VIVNVARLRKNEGASERFFFSKDFLSLDLGQDTFAFRSPLNVQIDAVNTGKTIVVSGKVETALNVNCSLCLKEFPYNLEFNFEDEWIPLEYVSEDLDETALIFEKDEFSLDDRIREHLLLHLPMKFTCSSDCKGLCPKCGADRNLKDCGCSNEEIDPRFEVLSRWNKGV